MERKDVNSTAGTFAKATLAAKEDRSVCASVKVSGGSRCEFSTTSYIQQGRANRNQPSWTDKPSQSHARDPGADWNENEEQNGMLVYAAWPNYDHAFSFLLLCLQNGANVLTFRGGGWHIKRAPDAKSGNGFNLRNLSTPLKLNAGKSKRASKGH